MFAISVMFAASLK